MDSYNPIYVTPIQTHGPIIDIVIKRAGSNFAGINARGLIDTGATDILVSPDIAEKLTLKHVNDDILNVVGGGSVSSKVYSGLIEAPALNFSKIFPIHVIPWNQTSHTVLLGREFLKHFMFYYDGPMGMFHFSKPIDGLSEAFENLDG